MPDTQSSQVRSAGDNSRKPPDRPRTLGSRPGFWPTALLAGASFLIMFEFLAFQLSHGNDPALGSAPATAPAKEPRPVLIRRVVDTRVVADRGSGAGAEATVSSGATSSGTSASSGASTATATPAAAPAPAPAAPVVSSSS